MIPARIALADAIRDFVGGLIDSDEFDKRIESAADEDPSLDSIFLWLWLLYDDFKNRPLNPDPVLYLQIKRVYAFLRSGIAYLPPQTLGEFCSCSKWTSPPQPTGRFPARPSGAATGGWRQT